MRNASSEVEYDWPTSMVWSAKRGRGAPPSSRWFKPYKAGLHAGSATSMRTGLTRAIHQAQHRKASVPT